MSLKNLVKHIREAWLPLPCSIYPPDRKPLLWPKMPKADTISNPDEFIEQLTRSVESCVSKSRKVCLWLSGGIDSSLLLAILAKTHSNVQAVTIDFQSYPSEVDRSIAVAEQYKTPITIHKIGLQDHIRQLSETLAMLREPVDVAVQVTEASRIAKNLGCDMILSALGADELFCGYPVHVNCKERDYPKIEEEQLNKCQSHYVYINSTASLLPVKYPYLTPDFVSYARGLPLSCKRFQNKTKILMRRKAWKLIPEANRLHGLTAGTKYGFGPNIKHWWMDNMRDWVREQIPKLPFKIRYHFMSEIALNNFNPDLKPHILTRLATVPTLLNVCGGIQ